MGSHALGSSERPLRVAVVGAGPAGFYTADALLKNRNITASVDVFERLLAPYGLVRFGVAPDHQKIKSVTKAFDKTASHERFRLLANVDIGATVPVETLQRHYDQIVFTVGCGTDRQLGIEGEDLTGSHPATDFVAWYNGHPDFRHYSVELAGTEVAVVGIGDVSMDITRMLLKPFDELAQTDCTDYALAVFRAGRVDTVHILARRGPAQSAFAIKELRDVAELPGVDVVVSEADIVAAQEDGLPNAVVRKLEFLLELARRPQTPGNKRVVLHFLASPAKIIDAGGKVGGLSVERNELVTGADGWVSAQGTGQLSELPVSMVFRAVGYRGVPIPGLPFDDRKGLLPNADGRLLDGGTVLAGLYAAGWIKRGPSGVIGTNKACAVDTVAKMLEDIASLPGGDVEQKRPAAIDAALAESGVRVITMTDWQKIDAIELKRGEEHGKLREKFTSADEAIAALG